MEVAELGELATWAEREIPPIRTAYANLLNVLQHNAQQPDKRPLETELERLATALEEMEFDELSLQQLEVLERLEVRNYLGRDGIVFLDNTVRTANFDPATAVSKVQDVVSKLDNTVNALSSYQNVMRQLNFASVGPDELPDRIVVRIGFQNDAKIANVSDWRESGKDWYDIIRGIALAANESPEDTKVIGAATGSVILILGGTVAVTTMLAVISKNITTVAKDIMSVGIERENLRQKKMLNSVIDAELTKLESKKRSEAIKSVMAEIKKYLHKQSLGDAKVALEASVKKLLDFNEKGGVVDFVAPPEPVSSDEEAAASDRAGYDLLADVRRAIHEFQGERESLRLLTDESAKAADVDDE